MNQIAEFLRIREPVDSPVVDSVDDAHMRRALSLASRGMGDTYPNPQVGAVVVADGEIVGEGYHQRCGQAHAEVRALEDAGDRARGATMYVTLEPCDHHGRTPPCVDAVIAAGVSRVVISLIDPDSRVSGRGVERLRSVGVRVDVGCLAPQAVAHNVDYFRNHLNLGPTVSLKMAVTLDGRIARAPGRRDRITGHAAHYRVHRLRAGYDCVVIGVDTVIVDRPRLDCRFLDTSAERALPTPVVLDTHLRMPLENRWAKEGRAYLVMCGRDADASRQEAIERGSGRVVRCEVASGRVSIRDAIRQLVQDGYGRILVEGGAGVFTSFVDDGAWDALYIFQSPVLFGGEGVPLYHGSRGDIDGRLVDTERIENDTLHRFLNPVGLDMILERIGA